MPPFQASLITSRRLFSFTPYYYFFGEWISPRHRYHVFFAAALLADCFRRRYAARRSMPRHCRHACAGGWPRMPPPCHGDMPPPPPFRSPPYADVADAADTFSPPFRHYFAAPILTDASPADIFAARFRHDFAAHIASLISDAFDAAV
jgi:hypothetical protein